MLASGAPDIQTQTPKSLETVTGKKHVKNTYVRFFNCKALKMGAQNQNKNQYQSKPRPQGLISLVTVEAPGKEKAPSFTLSIFKITTECTKLMTWRLTSRNLASRISNEKILNNRNQTSTEQQASNPKVKRWHVNKPWHAKVGMRRFCERNA